MIDFIQVQRLAHNRRQFIDIFEMVYNYITKFIVFQSEDEPIVVTNWIVHTYLIHLFEYTPYLHIYSAVKQCGKTLLLSLIKDLSYKGEMLINFSEPIFRYIDKEEPTLCIDEVDRWNKEDKETIWGIINSGFYRRGGSVMRMVGNNSNIEPKKFKTFCPKVLSGIDRNSLVDTVQDRSIPIELVRKLQTEPVQRFRHREQVSLIDEMTEVLEELTECTARDHSEEFSLFDEVHENALIEIYQDEILNDRALDIVEPLVVVASMGTSEWLDKTIKAVVKLSNRVDEEDDNQNLEILRVCNHIRMLNIGSKHIFSEDLVKDIHNQKESGLAYMNNGYGLNQNDLAKALGTFGIKTKQVRIGTESKRGYVWDTFKDPVSRFLSDSVEEEPVIEIEEEIVDETIEQVEIF